LLFSPADFPDRQKNNTAKIYVLDFIIEAIFCQSSFRQFVSSDGKIIFSPSFFVAFVYFFINSFSIFVNFAY